MTRRTAIRTALLLTVLALAAPATARATDIVCHANYDFCVEVDGKFPQDARFFTADERGRFLVDIPSKSAGLLIDLPSRKAIAVPRNLITPDASPAVLKVSDNIPASATAYALSIEGPVLRFETDSAKVRVLKVLDRPPVVGAVAIDDLIADRMEYREGMKAYNPDKTSMDALKADKKPIELEAYFATWCPHCKMFMPKFLRVIKDANNANIKVTLVGVPRNFGAEKGPWEGKGIQNIPAILIKQNGKDITRLATHETAVPEVELAALLSALK
jgi:thiol-disulfide isomerase/thioredoxin